MIVKDYEPSIVHDDVNFKFSILDHEDIEEAAQCIAQTFSEKEPLTHILNISREEFYVFSRYLCIKASHQQLSLVIRNRENKIVACFIVDDNSQTKEEVILPVISEKFAPIMALLESSHIDDFKTEHEKKAHLFILAVNNTYQGLGIAKLASALQLNYLAKKNYTYFTAEFTNPFSFKAFKSIIDNDIKHSKEIIYNTFNYNGQLPFAELEGKVVSCLHPIVSLKPHLEIWAKLQYIKERAVLI